MRMKEVQTIKHSPNLTGEDMAKVIEYYSAQDGVDVKYVCTTDLVASDTPVDVFFRETPHPEFGNRYFGLYYDYYRDAMMITNADMVEELSFGMIENDEGDMIYSRSHHDFNVCPSGNYVDGGRLYIRSNVRSYPYMVRDGEMVYSEDLDVYPEPEN